MEKVRLYLPCYYSPDYKKSSGGTISNYHLVEWLSSFFSVEIVTPDSNCITEGNVNVKTIKGRGGYFGRVISFIWLLSKVFFDNDLKKFKFVFFTNGTSHLPYMLKSKIGSDTKIVILTRAFEDFLSRKELSENRKRYLRRVSLGLLLNKLITKAYINSDIVITNSKFMAEEIKNYFHISDDKVFVLYPPVSKPSSISKKNLANKNVIGIINPSVNKGELIFLELARLFPDVDFYYWGKNDKKFVNSNIIYKGWESESDKIFHSIDLLIVPSQWEEPFGRVSVESIANKTPCFVSNIGGLPETVNRKWVVDSNNIDSWYEKIHSFFKDKSPLSTELVSLYDYIDMFSPAAHDEKLSEIFLIGS